MRIETLGAALFLSACVSPTATGPGVGTVLDAPDCPDGNAPPPPSWALKPGAPIGSVDDLTGMWISVSGYTTVNNPAPAPGPVQHVVSCYGDYRIMTLEQDGIAIRANWVYRDPASGAEFRDWHVQNEVAAGGRTGDRVRMGGYFLTQSGYVDAPEVHRECREVTYELTFDEVSGHLVGYRDEVEIRFAPYVLEARTEPCGDPPA